MGVASSAGKGAAVGSVVGPWGTAVGAGIGAIAGIWGSKKQSQSAKLAAEMEAKSADAAIKLERERDATNQRNEDLRREEDRKRWEVEEQNRAEQWAVSEQQRFRDNAFSDRQFEASQANQAASLGLSREEFAARQGQYQDEQTRRAPYRAAGQTALTSLGEMLGMSFPPGTAAPSAARTAPPVPPGAIGGPPAAMSAPGGGGSPTPEADAIARAQAAAGTAPTENMAAIPGFDINKLNDPTKSNAKYTNSVREFAYTLNAIQPSADPAGLAKAVEYLNTVRGVPAKLVGDDKVDFGDGFGPIDVLIDSGKGGYAFQNNPQPGSAGHITMANLMPGAVRPRVPVAQAAPVETAPLGATGPVIPMRNLIRRPREVRM